MTMIYLFYKIAIIAIKTFEMDKPGCIAALMDAHKKK